MSAFDAVPFRKDGRGVGTPEADMASYRNAFGLLADPAAAPDLEPARAFLRELEDLGIRWVSLSAGSPYYNPHIQRPALFPPSDGYLPPEDPLVGVRPADRGGRRAQARRSRTCGSSAPATPTCRSGCRTSARPRCATG